MEIEQLKQKNDRMFVLVCLNFAMLAILFLGAGYVLLQSASMINKLQEDLDNARLAMVDLKGQFQDMDVDTAVRGMVDDAAEKIRVSVSTSLDNADLGVPLKELSDRVQVTQQRLEKTGQAITAINEKLSDVDTEHLAQVVSYNMLKGLGDGFTQAAISRKPGG